MGFLGLVPADQVTAMYLVRERKLRLHARGTVPSITTGIKFTREPWLGGLKFLLEGWTGPLTGGTEQYNVELSFNIQLPNLATPSDDLIVVTANHPDGFKVPIRFDGFNPMPITSKEPPADPGKADEPRVGEEPTTPAPPVFLPNLGEDEQINALFKVGSFYDLCHGLIFGFFKKPKQNWRPPRTCFLSGSQVRIVRETIANHNSISCSSPS